MRQCAAMHRPGSRCTNPAGWVVERVNFKTSTACYAKGHLEQVVVWSLQQNNPGDNAVIVQAITDSPTR